MNNCDVLGVNMTSISMDGIVNEILNLSRTGINGYVCFVNVHSLVTAVRSDCFDTVLNKSLFSVPDGVPVVWLMRALGMKSADRICGPDLMLKLCESGAEHDLKVFLYGNTASTLAKMKNKLEMQFKGLTVVGTISPPFRELTYEEELEHAQSINKSGANFLFVSLGCPKQEKWMANMADKVECIALGVGAAFDFYVGNVKRAPIWMRKTGLEWLYRLLSEPARLWKRYFVTNTMFIYFAVLQLIFKRKFKKL